jgi:hypothetical protein
MVVSPITLKPRFNPNATGPEPEPDSGELPSQVDARQMSLFGAGWTVGSLKYLAEAAVHSATYFETTGPRGVMETEQGSPWPQRFRSRIRSCFPIYHVFADVCEFAGGEVVPCSSSQALVVEGLVLRKDCRTRILLANLTPDGQRVAVHHPILRGHLKCLDETNAEFAASSPEVFRTQQGQQVEPADEGVVVELLPFAVAQLDIKEEL